MAIEEYIESVRRAMVADGCEVTQEVLGDDSVLIGYRGNFKAATKLHTFTVITRRDVVDETAVREFTMRVVDLAKQRKGLWRGAQSGVLVLPALVSNQATPGAVALMAKPFRLNMGGFAAMAHPLVIDVSQGVVHTFRGTRWWGFVYNGLIRRKVAAYFPAPPRVTTAP
jgi:hypothetical protein